MTTTVHRWTDADGFTWLCAAYDHGPMCRQCWRVDDNVKKAVLAHIDASRFEVVGWGDGEPRLHVTPAGMRATQEILHGLASDDNESPGGAK